MSNLSNSTSVPDPRANGLIAALPQAEYQRLLPHLIAVSLDAGSMIATASGSGRFLYFPIDCTISVLHVDEDSLNEIAITGNEGAVGISLVLLGETARNRSIVINAGTAYQLKLEALARNFSLDSPLQQLLFAYSQVLITQMGQNAYCRHRHSAEQQLCRWLLACMDRMPSMPLKIKQPLLAEILGLTADSLAQAVKNLHGHGLTINENHLTVSDRELLQTRVCECYGLIQAKTDNWLAQQPQQ